MAWTAISNALVAVGALPFATTIQALRDNPIAIANGDVGAPRVQYAAISGTLGGIAAGAVGSYAMLVFSGSTTAGTGSTHAGSSLRYSNASGQSGGTPSGTWRLMGVANASANPQTYTSLFLRIS